MNNELASKVRNIGIDYILHNIIDEKELIKKDSGKFIFQVNDNENNKYYCEVDFICKKEDYTPDYDITKYEKKLKEREIKQKEKEENKKKAKDKKKNNDVE